MKTEQTLKLQAFLDGELTGTEERDIAAWLARDADAKALHTELRHTRKALKDSQPKVTLPESREFYWSKIRRDIERSAPAPAKPAAASPLLWLRRLLLQTGPITVLGVALLAGLIHFCWVDAKLGLATESTGAEAGTFTYHDDANGTTLVWVNFPAETEIAMNTTPW
jgi:anti-sigma factor RsiW